MVQGKNPSWILAQAGQARKKKQKNKKGKSSVWLQVVFLLGWFYWSAFGLAVSGAASGRDGFCFSMFRFVSSCFPHKKMSLDRHVSSAAIANKELAAAASRDGGVSTVFGTFK